MTSWGRHDLEAPRTGGGVATREPDRELPTPDSATTPDNSSHSLKKAELQSLVVGQGLFARREFIASRY